jgi:putative FmdB family regulatory protein
MPLFEYECKRCRRVFEAYKRPSEDASAEKCPACDRPAPKVEISKVGASASGGASGAGSASCGGGTGRSPFR